MQKSSNRPAKLSPPRLRAPIERERLFQRLDNISDVPLVWVGGNPGAGKTVAVSSWAKARGKRVRWYQVDVGDRDIASAFYQLGVATSADGRNKTSLPMFAGDDSSNMEGFVRRYFRAWWSLLPHETILVLDNFQEAAGALEPILEWAIEEVPTGSGIVVISRSLPPLSTARARAHGLILLIESSELNLTLAEAHSIAALQGIHEKQQIEYAWRISCGWPMGYAVLLEQAKQNAHADVAVQKPSGDATFDYFAGLLFRHLNVKEHRLLSLTALLPRFTAAQAVSLCGTDAVLPLVEYMYRRGLFVVRRQHSDPTYEYHALLRQFLMRNAQSTIDADELSKEYCRAASLLAESGQSDEAVTLWCQAKQWDGIGSRQKFPCTANCG